MYRPLPHSRLRGAIPRFARARFWKDTSTFELEGRTVSLDPHQAFTVPAGVMHRPHACGRTTVLMVEKGGVVPTGN